MRKIDNRHRFLYDFLMTNSVQVLIPIAISTAQGVRVVIRVTGENHRG